MTKRLLWIGAKAFAVACVIALTSCAMHTGQFAETQLSGPLEYRTVVVGQSQACNILGIGGSGRNTLLLEARKDMVRSHPLKAGESYANTTLDIATTNFWLFTKTTYTLAADVVASLDDSAQRTYSKGYTAFMELPDSISSFPAPGDTVLTENGLSYLLVTASSDGTAGVMDLSDRGLFHLVRVPLTDLFAKHGEHLGISVGDTFVVSKPNVYGHEIKAEKRVVVGLGTRKVMLKRLIRKADGLAGSDIKEFALYGELMKDARFPVRKLP